MNPSDENKSKADLPDEAHRIAKDAVSAVEDFAQAAVKLPADAAKLALDTLLAAVEKAKAVVRDVTNSGSDR